MRKILLEVLLSLFLVSCGVNASMSVSDSADSDTPFFYEQQLYAPGDYQSQYWRIPAIAALPDGSLLVVNDKRKFNEGDLPSDIDIVARRSEDCGRTWSHPVTLAKGTGVKHGFGDPAIVVADDYVLCAFVGGNGLWASSLSDPIRSYVSSSSDGGRTWSSAVDITSQLWGESATNPECRHYKASFFASGNGLILTRGNHAGRILFVAAMCRDTVNVLDNFVVYSDDHGQTWQVSSKAFTGGDEAKLVELVDGRILLSVRQHGARGYNISSDGGSTWGIQGEWPEMTTNACNGDIIRYAAVDRGDSCNILLHSITNSMSRENVSVFVSYDEGRTWQDPVSLYRGPSVYSSLTVLSDGTIAAFIEKNPHGPCELWFQHFSFKWLLSQMHATDR